MPTKPRSHEESLRETRPASHGRAVSDRDYRLRRSDASVDPLQAQAEKIRHSGRWRRLREVVLAREPLCRVCLAHGITRAAVDVDHIVALVDLLRDGRRELAFAFENLQPLCRPDHAAKTAAERRAREGAGRPEIAPHSAPSAPTPGGSADNRKDGGVVHLSARETSESGGGVVAQHAGVSGVFRGPPGAP